MIAVLSVCERFIVCLKPCRVLSTDEPGGLPGLLREQLGIDSVYTVHRLDRVVGGVMLLARDKKTASELSKQVMGRDFKKEYLAVVHGSPEEPCGTLTDLLRRDKAERKTYVADAPGKDVQQAVLDYETLGESGGLSLLRIRLRTGRTHQIRAQLSSRCLPLYGDRKYSLLEDEGDIALWSHKIGFTHPDTGETLCFSAPPPQTFPWTEFEKIL